MKAYRVTLAVAWAALAIPLLPAAAQADVRNDVLAGAARCAGITENRAWLDCYYGAAQPMRAVLGLPPAPQARMTPPPANVPPPATQFGLAPVVAAPVVPAASRVQGRMASYAFDKAGYFTVTLANGEIWRQAAGDTMTASWSAPAPSYTVLVTRGALGSFNLSVGDGRSYKVKRVQ